MAALCGMSTIQFSTRSARSYIYWLSPFRHIAVSFVADLTILRRHQALDMACRVARERASDVAENLGDVSCTERTNQ